MIGTTNTEKHSTLEIKIMMVMMMTRKKVRVQGWSRRNEAHQRKSLRVLECADLTRPQPRLNGPRSNRQRWHFHANCLFWRNSFSPPSTFFCFFGKHFSSPSQKTSCSQLLKSMVFVSLRCALVFASVLVFRMRRRATTMRAHACVCIREYFAL